MLKLYLKQARTMLRQNRLFSSIYVLGTGLSIALTMTLFIIFYVKMAPIYPEYNRDRTVALTMLKCYPKDRPENWHAGNLNHEVGGLLDSLPHLEALACVTRGFYAYNFVAVAGSDAMFTTVPLYVNAGFWQVFTFRYLSGKPFTAADVEARTPVAVLSESLSRRLFATSDAAGRQFLFKGNPYTVCGVVDDVSTATPATAADLWLPVGLFSEAFYREPVGEMLRGNLQYYLLASSVSAKKALKAEVRDAFRRHDEGLAYVNDLMGQPDDAALSSFRTSSTAAPDLSALFRSLLFIVAALLFIPALNLSGMIASRMERRMAELGIRKAYGATNRALLGQVMWENLLLTLLGGVLGLVFCYLIVLTSGSWVLTLFDAEVETALPVPTLTWEMLFNPWVFLCAFGLCLVLNVVSALLPAWWGLRHTIVQELYAKR